MCNLPNVYYGFARLAFTLSRLFCGGSVVLPRSPGVAAYIFIVFFPFFAGSIIAVLRTPGIRSNDFISLFYDKNAERHERREKATENVE